jgi:hypothetical protein
MYCYDDKESNHIWDKEYVISFNNKLQNIIMNIINYNIMNKRTEIY